MGVAPPPAAGRVSSTPPGMHAGNLDNRELVAGTTLYIPVHVPGALFEVGDGHAAQGDGEVDQTAIETSLRGTAAAHRAQGHDARRGRAPRRRPTTSAWATDEDLTKATKIAIQEMIDFLAATQGLDKHAGLSADEHRRQRRHHPARGPEGRRPREDAQGHLPEVSAVSLPGVSPCTLIVLLPG